MSQAAIGGQHSTAERHADAAAPTMQAATRETLMPMLEGLSRALGYRRALVALYDSERGALRGTVGLNVPDFIVESIEVPLGQTDNPMVIALREGLPQRVDDVRTETRL